MARVDLEAVLSAVDSLLAGALDGAALPAAVEEMRYLFDGSKACFTRFGPDARASDCVTTNPDDEMQKRCVGDLASEFGFFVEGIAKVPVGDVYQDEALFGRERLRSSRAWQEWMSPQDMFGGIGCRLLEDSNSFWFFDVQRGSRQEAFDSEDAALLARIAPVLRRVAEMRQRIGVLTIERERTRHALDALSVAVMIVDPSLKLIHANHAAEAILARPHGAIGLRAGRLFARNQSGSAQLKQVVLGCLEQPSGADCTRGHLLMRGTEELERGISVCAMPMPSGYGLSDNPHDVMIMARPLALAADLASAAQQLFGLTKAEAKLASALASGMSLADAAQEQGVRISTARTHLARIFEKTGTHQQSQVAVLLRSAELPLRTAGTA